MTNFFLSPSTYLISVLHLYSHHHYYHRHQSWHYYYYYYYYHRLSVHSSFLGFKRIVDNDVKDLLEKFQNVKLSSINDKLDDMPTREENERVIEKLFSFHTSMMDELTKIESLPQKVGHKLDGKLKNND